MKLLIFSTLVLLVSCSTPAPKVSSQWTNPDMTPQRFPASVNKVEELEQGASEMVFAPSEEKAEEAVSEQINGYQEAYLRTHDYLKKFDADLDRAVQNGEKFELAKNNNYQRMLVLWDIRTRMRDRVVYAYFKAMKYSQSHEQGFASKVLSRFSHHISTLTSAEKKTVGDLTSDLKQVQDFFDSNPSAADFARVEKGDVSWIFEKVGGRTAAAPRKLQKGFPSQGQELLPSNQEVIKEKKEQQEIDKMAKQLSTVTTELSQEIEAEAAALEIESTDRTPQAVAKYIPSVGKTGNLTGNEFPANTWAITFDDGPHASRTAQVLQSLKDYGVSGTFFQLGSAVRANPTLVGEISKSHTIANHTFSHPQLTKLSGAEIKTQIKQTGDLIEKATGSRPKFMRCPYGAGVSNSTVRQVIADEGMIHVFWNVDTLDWQDKDPDSIVQRAMKQMIANGKGVVLFHDIHPQSVKAIRLLLQKTNEITKSGKGTYKWKSLPSIVQEMNARE